MESTFFSNYIKTATLRDDKTTIHELCRRTRANVGLSSRYAVFRRAIVDKDTFEKTLLNQFESKGYIVSELPGGGELVKMHPEFSAPEICVAYTMEDGHVIARITGDEKYFDEVEQLIKEQTTEIGTLIKTVTGINQYGHLVFTNSFIDKETSDLAKNVFYPWLTVSLDEYFDAFLNSNEFILLLMGPPGLGKSTFMRSLFLRVKQALLAYAPEVVGRSELMAGFLDAHGKLLGIEDADRFLGKREDGNMIMSSMLNGTDGLVKRAHKKVVISTNLDSINKIDPALLRVGRCFDILKFRMLTSEEALAARQAVGMSEKDFLEKQSWSLAEALVDDSLPRQTINRFATRTGLI